jgi:UDP-GlcNAc:undecaprenyl-phosphate/decaprenyl-phosphate GlcNAc-1-phosphate transferase
MVALPLLALLAFVVVLVATPLVRDVSLRRGVVDLPDSTRKLHQLPVPRTGGVAIALGCVFTCAVFLLSPLRTVVDTDLQVLAALLGATSVVFATGLLDDLYGLGARGKFAGLTVAACVAWYYAGVDVRVVAGFEIPGWWSLPVTVIWLVGCANAFNLIDGVDGLASGIGLVACLTTLFAALLSDNLPLALAMAPLAGALFAFLRYNFNPASIFLGDCGSLTIGFVLGCCGALWSQKATTLVGMLAPLMALSVPLLDTGLTILRRFMRRRPIFTADRNHIHHRLLENGLTHRHVFVALCGMGLLAGTFALVQTATHSRYGGLLAMVFAVAVWVSVRVLGYAEFTTARYLASTNVFRQMLDVHVEMQHIEQRLGRAATRADVWAAVRDAAQSFGFVQVIMTLEGETFSYDVLSLAPDEMMSTRIPLPDGSIDFVSTGHLSMPRAVAANALGELLHRVLEPRAARPVATQEPVTARGLAASQSITHAGAHSGDR